MPLVSNNPAWLSYLDWCRVLNYFIVAASTAVVYDWVLTFAQEFELVWRRRWSLVTVLYICVRYLGILYSIVYILGNLPVSMTDLVGAIFYFIMAWTPVVVNAMLGIIMMTRIQAMYRRSKTISIFLVVVLLASTIASAVMTGMGNIHVSGEELILFGIHTCSVLNDTNDIHLNGEVVIPTVVWEILALCLAVWIVVLRFCELRRSQTGSPIGDSFTMLIKSHVLYFVAFAAVSCFQLGSLSVTMTNSISTGTAVYHGILQIAQFMQMFVLGPRLILSVREYHAKLVMTSSYEETGMTTLSFRERGHVSTDGSSV
ncbi:uncharacterized protein EDB91DRAFT_1347220 [Suillus paluster]|uniref:uncharacterized protein n=1 Tax=Suillus paluster TaxID=48578 RepID=UPI001B8659C1|nr:uncharacterized protein EDB91DRAFT_1347220 [Suillus paluster]KAG1739856.1 hypothetical protein EDB91DRAFT_1347220 [Suillus paluster]